MNYALVEPIKLWTKVTGEFALELMMPKLKTRIFVKLYQDSEDILKTKKVDMEGCKLAKICVSKILKCSFDIHSFQFIASKI